MPRTRLHISSPLSPASEIQLNGESAHYIGRSLRLGPKDELTVFDGRGGEYCATILAVERNSVSLSIAQHIERDVESPLAIHLLQGISRGDRMDVVMQKATELGVHRITPVATEHSVVKLAPARAEKRLQHWRGITRSACEQSGRNILPGVDPPLPLRSWLGENVDKPGLRLILKPGGEVSLSSLDGDPRQVTLLIGPEGGFSEAEYELAEATGFVPVHFGGRILRTETAAIAALAALQTLYGDLGGRAIKP